jgi:exodeoxyribonuclease VII large subunit
MAVPVRSELAAVVAGLDARRLGAMERALDRCRQRVTDLCRALPRPDAILAERRQRLDLATTRLARPDRIVAERRHALDRAAARLAPALRAPIEAGRLKLVRTAARLSRPDRLIAERRHALERTAARLALALRGREQRARIGLMQAGSRLAPGRLRERVERAIERLEARGSRSRPAVERALRARAERLAASARVLRSLGPNETLARGFAIVRDAEGRVVPRAAAVGPGAAMDLQFADGHVAATAAGRPAEAPARADPGPRRRERRRDERQGTLF